MEKESKPYLGNLIGRIITENYFIKFICFICALWFIYDELFQFLIVRPTSTSDGLASLDSKTFPEIMVCTSPPYNLEKLEQYGYSSVILYYLGLMQDGSFIGWGGVENMSSREILENVVSVKDHSEIFYVEFYSKDNYSYIPAKVEPERANYPFGRCFKIQTDDPFKNEGVVSVSISILARSPENQTVKVYFSDRINDAKAIR